MTAYGQNSTGSVQILLDNGDGTFRTGAVLPTGQSADGIAAADIDGDGFPDLVVTSELGNTVSLLTSNHDGTFKAFTKLFTGAGPAGVAIGDFNNDGHADIVFTNTMTGTISVALAQSGGGFEFPQNYVASYETQSLIVTDVNEDESRRHRGRHRIAGRDRTGRRLRSGHRLHEQWRRHVSGRSRVWARECSHANRGCRLRRRWQPRHRGCESAGQQFHGAVRRRRRKIWGSGGRNTAQRSGRVDFHRICRL